MSMRLEDALHRFTEKTSAGSRGLLLYLIYALAIATILSLYYVIKHRAFAFVDIGIDSFNFYYSIQVAQAQQLRELHNLTWSFRLGLGGYLGMPINPLRLLCAPLPDSWQLGARLPIYFIRVILSGAFFYGYLRRIRFDTKPAVIGALAFAYSSYAVINGQWDSEGLVVMQLAAYLFFFESYLCSKKMWFAVGAGITLGAGSIFYPFTFVILSALYVIIRPVFIARVDTWTYLLVLIKFVGWTALGFLLTAFIQLSNFYYFLNSPRVTGGHSVFDTLLSHAWTLNHNIIIYSEIAGIFGKDLLGVGSSYHGYSNWFEAPGFYVGMLSLLCISQLFGPSAKPREKLLGFLGIALFVTYSLWPFMRYAVYGFGHGGFRLSTLWVSAGLLILGLVGLQRALRSGTWRTGLVAAAIGIVIVVLGIAFHTPAHVRVQRVTMVIAFTAIYCVMIWPSGNGTSRVSTHALIAVFACELLLFSMPAFTQRNAVDIDGTSSIGSYLDGTKAALALAREKDGTSEFYRVEKTYQSVYLNDALVQGYSGTKSDYFHGKSITRFVDKMGLPRPHPRTAYIGSMVNRPKVLDLLGVKYLLARNRKLDAKPGMAYVGKAGKINVYRNTDAHGIAHLYQKFTGEKAADKLSKDRRDALLLDSVLVEDPQAIRQQLAALDKQPAHPTATSSVTLKKLTSVHLRADVTTPEASILLIAMPYDRGWTASVEGKSTPMFRADYGLTALLLPPGHHRIEFHYAVPGRITGIWISLAALVILLAIGVFLFIRSRSQMPGKTKHHVDDNKNAGPTFR